MRDLLPILAYSLRARLIRWAVLLALLSLVGSPTAAAEEAPKKEEEGPPPFPREILVQVQRDVDYQAKIIDFKGQERLAFTYAMRFQETKTVIGLIKPFADAQGQTLDLAYRNAIFFIADGPSTLQILDMLAVFDNPSPQVQIEAKVVEITHSNDFQWGINVFFDKGLGRDTVTGEITPLIADDSALTFFRKVRGLFDPDAFLDTTSPFRGGEITFGNVDPFNIGDIGRFDVVVRALEDTGRAEILSQPSILATVGKKAFINVGEDVPVPKIQDRANGANINGIEFKPVGVKLEVTPLIIAEDQITLQIKPEVSFVIEFILTGVSGFASPRISTRNVDTTVSVRDGEAIVIGGLIRREEDTDELKFPVLGDVPVLGNLFKTYRKRNEKTEVFFFLEPHVLTNRSRRPAVYVPDAGSR